MVPMTCAPFLFDLLDPDTLSDGTDPIRFPADDLGQLPHNAGSGQYPDPALLGVSTQSGHSDLQGAPAKPLERSLPS